MIVSRFIQSESNPDILLQSALERICQLEKEIQLLGQGASRANRTIRIHQANRIITVLASEILYIMAEDNYSRIFLKNGSQYYVSRTLKSWAIELGDADFLRCHRTYLVNRTEVVEINRRKFEIVLRNAIAVPTSRRFQKSCLATLFPKEIIPTHQAKTIVHALHPARVSNGKYVLMSNSKI